LDGGEGDEDAVIPPQMPAGGLIGQAVLDDEPHGHPRVFLNLGPDGKVECPYCSRLFVNRAMQRTDAADATTPPRVSEERNV